MFMFYDLYYFVYVFFLSVLRCTCLRFMFCCMFYVLCFFMFYVFISPDDLRCGSWRTWPPRWGRESNNLRHNPLRLVHWQFVI